MKKVSLFIFASLMCLSASAFAQDPAQAGTVQYERETEFDFEAENIEGTVVRPDGELIGGQRGRQRSSLLPVRQDFVPEMVKSVETL
jgi:hypothetical protein